MHSWLVNVRKIEVHHLCFYGIRREKEINIDEHPTNEKYLEDLDKAYYLRLIK
jgi:hypothetical protein